MNFKSILLGHIRRGKKFAIEQYQEMDYGTEAIEKAYQLIEKILETRFENELKKQNQDEKKAYDAFTARQNLDYLLVYTEEMLLLDKPEEQIETYKAVRKEMRRLIQELYELVLTNEKKVLV